MIGGLSFLILILTSSLFFLTPTAKAQEPVLVWIETPTEPLAIGETFNVTIHIDNMPRLPDTGGLFGDNGIAGIEFVLTWNPNVIEAVSITDVLYHTAVPEEYFESCVWEIKCKVSNVEEVVGPYGTMPAHAWYAYLFLDPYTVIESGYAPIIGNQTLAIITFNTTGIGLTAINFAVLKIGDFYAQDLTVHGVNYFGIGGSVTVGNPPPYIGIISPQNGTIYATGNIPLIFNLTEEVSWIGYSLDGGANRTITGNTTITVADGTHSLIIYANDTTGQMGASDPIYFTVDSTPPVASFTYSPEKPEPKIVFGAFRWNVTFDASESYDDVTNIEFYIWDFGDGFTITVNSPIVSHEYRKPGTYNVTLKVVDTAGNYGTKIKAITIPDAPVSPTIPYGLIVAAVLPALWLVSLRAYLKRLKKKKSKS